MTVGHIFNGYRYNDLGASKAYTLNGAGGRTFSDRHPNRPSQLELKATAKNLVVQKKRQRKANAAARVARRKNRSRR